MSTVRVDDITDESASGSPTFSNGITFGTNRRVWKRKYLTANQTTTGVMSDLTFTNIEADTTYKLELHLISFVGAVGRTLVRIKQGATVLGRIDIQNLDGTLTVETAQISLIYVSPNTTDITVDVVTLSGASSPEVSGDGTLDGTWFQIEEIPTDFLNPTETTKWN